jgi:hypothetical protein
MWESASTKLPSLKNLRGLGEFAWRDNFSRPQSFSDAKGRVERNISYFASNYAALMLLFLVMTMLTSPFLLVSIIALSAVWYHATRVEDLELGSIALRGRQKTIFLGLITAIVLFVVAGSTLFNVVGFSIFCTCVSALPNQSLCVTRSPSPSFSHSMYYVYLAGVLIAWYFSAFVYVLFR